MAILLLKIMKLFTVLELAELYGSEGNPHWSGRLSSFDYLVPTSLDKLIFAVKNIIYLFLKKTALMRRSSVLFPPLRYGFPEIGGYKNASPKKQWLLCFFAPKVEFEFGPKCKNPTVFVGHVNEAFAAIGCFLILHKK